MIKIQQIKKVAKDELRDLNVLLMQLSASKKPMTMAYLNKLFSMGTSALFVAKDGKKIIGMATLVLVYMPSGLETLIEDVVVDEKYRGKGIGEKLVRALVELAIKKRAASINLTSRPARVAANKLYRKLGFELRETNAYRKKLK